MATSAIRLQAAPDPRNRTSLLRHPGIIALCAILVLIPGALRAQCPGMAHIDLCDRSDCSLATALRPIIVPVGCRLPYPRGCVTGETLSLRVTFEGKPFAFEPAALRFRTLTPEEFKRLEYQRGPNLVGADAPSQTIRFEPGRILIHNIPGSVTKTASTRFEGPPLVEFVPPFTAESFLIDPPERAISFDVLFEILLGNSIENTFRMTYEIEPCPPEVTGGDTIKLLNNWDYDLAVLLVDYFDASSSTSVDDLLLRARASSGSPDLLASTLPPPPLSPQIAVLSKENAFHFDPSVSGTATVHNQALEQLVKVPLNIWVAPGDSTKLDSWTQTAAKLVWAANLVYNDQRVGVWFDASNRITKIPSSTTTIPPGCGGPFVPPHYKSTELNIYLVSNISGGVSGVNCANRNVIFIDGNNPSDDVLAHEIGHAFGLNGGPNNGHATHPAFRCKNIMFEGTEVRRFITVGQAYRMNIRDESVLNLNGHRLGPGSSPAESRACPLTSQPDRDCPDLAKDVPGTYLEFP